MQEKIHGLFTLNVTNSSLNYELNLFESSVIQKLWSSEYYFNELLTLDIHKFLVLPPESNSQSVSDIPPSVSTTIQTTKLDLEGFCRQLNLLLDGFFMNSMSVLDTLAHEIPILYSQLGMQGNIYIGTLSSALLQTHPTLELSKFLEKQLSMAWFVKFSPFRHCTTHESLIGVDNIKFRFDQITRQIKMNKIRLPDNPQVRPFTYQKRRMAVDFCQTSLNKVRYLVLNAYKKILKDIRGNNNIIPI